MMLGLSLDPYSGSLRLITFCSESSCSVKSFFDGAHSSTIGFAFLSLE